MLIYLKVVLLLTKSCTGKPHEYLQYITSVFITTLFKVVIYLEYMAAFVTKRVLTTVKRWYVIYRMEAALIVSLAGQGQHVTVVWQFLDLFFF